MSPSCLRFSIHPTLDFIGAAVKDGARDGDEETDEADEGVLDDVGVDLGKSPVGAEHRGDGGDDDPRHEKANANDCPQKPEAPRRPRVTQVRPESNIWVMIGVVEMVGSGAGRRRGRPPR